MFVHDFACPPDEQIVVSPQMLQRIDILVVPCTVELPIGCKHCVHSLGLGRTADLSHGVHYRNEGRKDE